MLQLAHTVDPASLPAAGAASNTHSYYPLKTYREKDMKRKDVNVSTKPETMRGDARPSSRDLRPSAPPSPKND